MKEDERGDWRQQRKISVNLKITKKKSTETIQPKEQINIELPSNLEITLWGFYSKEMNT